MLGVRWITPGGIFIAANSLHIELSWNWTLARMQPCSNPSFALRNLIRPSFGFHSSIRMWILSLFSFPYPLCSYWFFITCFGEVTLTASTTEQQLNNEYEYNMYWKRANSGLKQCLDTLSPNLQKTTRSWVLLGYCNDNIWDVAFIQRALVVRNALLRVSHLQHHQLTGSKSANI